jgi:hypothetical protein
MPPDPAPLLDPGTYVSGVPYELLASLRRAAPVVWVDEPDGSGFWLVMRHADVETVLKAPGRTPHGSARPRSAIRPRPRRWRTYVRTEDDPQRDSSGG